jgi:DNA-binding GntR family transcriptional regulator
MLRRPLRDDVHRELCDRISRGVFPPGMRLRDAALAQELGVSRTPVREALLRLVADGLVEADLGRGFTVRPLTAEETGHLGELLSTLECLALRGIDVFPDARLDQLDDLNGQIDEFKDDAERALALNDEWHFLLLDGCRNSHLRTMIGTARDACRRYVHAYMRDRGRVEHATHQHAAIVQHLRMGEKSAAEAALAGHWRSGVAALQLWIEQSGVDMLPALEA